jgi:hypothetical protein
MRIGPREWNRGGRFAFGGGRWASVRVLGRGAPSRAVVHETARGRLARPPPFRERWGRLGASRFHLPCARMSFRAGPDARSPRGRRSMPGPRGIQPRPQPGESRATMPRPREPAPRSVRSRCSAPPLAPRVMAGHTARRLLQRWAHAARRGTERRRAVGNGAGRSAGAGRFLGSPPGDGVEDDAVRWAPLGMTTSREGESRGMAAVLRASGVPLAVPCPLSPVPCPLSPSVQPTWYMRACSP